jgi:prophage regulatory protein
MDSPLPDRSDGLLETAHEANAGAGPRLERLPSVLARTGLSRTTIWRRAGVDFPAPVRLGPSTVAWVSKEVDQWITDRIAASRGGAK